MVPQTLEARVARLEEQMSLLMGGRTDRDQPAADDWQQTVGMEEFLVRMVTEPEFVIRAIDAYVTRSLAYIEAMLQVGCHAIMTTDDYSDNHGPIMGPERCREFILPGLVRQVEAAHARGGYFIKHTDGNVWKILDAMIETGIDAWHGIHTPVRVCEISCFESEYRQTSPCSHP